jgi:hypothetical protein
MKFIIASVIITAVLFSVSFGNEFPPQPEFSPKMTQHQYDILFNGASGFAYTLVSLYKLIALPQYSAEYNATAAVLSLHFDPNITLFIGGSVFIGRKAVIQSLTMPGSIPHPNTFGFPRPILVNSTVGYQNGKEENAIFQLDKVPAFGVLPDNSYQLQVVQDIEVWMRKTCGSENFLLFKLNVTNTPVS